MEALKSCRVIARSVSVQEAMQKAWLMMCVLCMFVETLDNANTMKKKKCRACLTLDIFAPFQYLTGVTCTRWLPSALNLR